MKKKFTKKIAIMSGYMVIGAFMQCIFFSLLLAGNTNAQRQSLQEVYINLKVEGSVYDVFKAIEEKTDFRFSVNHVRIKESKKISLEVNRESLMEVLEKLSREFDLEFKRINQSIHVSALNKQNKRVIDQEIWEQTRQVSGMVRSNEDNIGLPGVNVVIKGTAQGTVTDVEGKYTISVPSTDVVLVFSSVGYTTEEVLVGNQNVINITLVVDITSLKEVVVVGYGTQSRKNLTSSITSVDPEDLNRGAISDVGQLLQGKVPGLNITRSGDPNRSAAIVMRGVSTLREGAQSPLFVIDGVVGANISLIAPDDIVSIEVLKDASATAIYGNRAANGVILVTTKRPIQGQMQLNYSGYMGIDRVSNQYEMMDANQLRSYLQENGQSLAPDDDLGVNTNWQSAVQRPTAVSHNHNISLGGGTELTQYSASLNYFDQEGIMKVSGLSRVIARLSINQKAFNEKLKLGLSVSNSISDAQYVPYRNTVLAQMITYLPTVPIRRDDGTYYENLTRTSYYNPVSMLENAKEESTYKSLLGTFSAQLDLPFGLTYDLNVSYQNSQNNYGAFYNNYYTENYNNVRSTPDPPGNPVFINLTGRNGQAVRNTYEYTTKLLETYLTWERSFDIHTLNLVLGYSWQENINGNGFQATSTNFPVNEVGYNNLGLGNSYAVPSFRVDFGPDRYEQIRLISDFARLNYNFDNRYIFQLSVRRDGSSVFGANEQWGYFPSIGVAWRISQESFMQNQGLFNELKLRASYGITGNSLGFSPYTTKLIYGSVGTFYYQGNQISAIGAVQNENLDLRWEKTAMTNFGIDFSLLQNRLSGTLEVYDKTTTDLIWAYPVSTSIYPFGTLIANVGEMQNRGIELNLNVTAVQNKTFSYSTGINLSHNKNILVSLSNSRFQMDSIAIFQPDGGGQTGETIQVLMEGQPIGQFFTYRYAGKDENGVSQYLDAQGELTTTPQMWQDYQLVGNAQPKILIGWTNNFQYKKFDLNVFFHSFLGNKIMNVTLADLYRPTTARLANIPVEVGSESVNDVNSYRYSSRFLENGSFLRLDNATLGYNFTNLSSDFKALRLYLSVNNLFVITKYKGIDPEINQGGLSPGIDARNFYPKTRTFMLGVKASF